MVCTNSVSCVQCTKKATIEEAIDKHIPIDRGWAWMIVLGAFLNAFFMIGISKSQGILIEEFVEYFQVSVAVGAMVTGMAGLIFTLGSPITMIVGEQYSVRSIVILGGIVGFVGVSLSSLAFNIEYLVFTYGFCFGFGNACMFGNGIIMIGLYFRKRRSLANGLALVGGSIGQFVFPPLLQYLLEKFSLKGCLLILGACYLHVALSGLLFRPLSFYEKKKKTDFEVNKSNSVRSSIQSMEEIEIMRPTETQQLMEKLVKVNQSMDQTKESGSASSASLRSGSLNNDSIHVHVPKSSNKEIITSDMSLVIELSKPKHPVKLKSQKRIPLSCCSHHQRKSKKNTISWKKLKKIWDFSIFHNATFRLYIIFIFFQFFGYFNFIIFIAPYLVSENVTHYMKAMVISVCGIGEIVGRLSTGFLADLNFIERYKILIVMCLTGGINTLLFTFAIEYWRLILHAFVYGFTGGAFAVLNPLVLTDFIGLDLLPRAFGLTLFFQGIASAVGQPFLGWIRDSFGSYKPVLYMCGSAATFGSFVLACHPFLLKWQQKMQERNLKTKALDKGESFPSEL